jgi:hypothetical protein
MIALPWDVPLFVLSICSGWSPQELYWQVILSNNHNDMTYSNSLHPLSAFGPLDLRMLQMTLHPAQVSNSPVLSLCWRSRTFCVLRFSMFLLQHFLRQLIYHYWSSYAKEANFCGALDISWLRFML